MPSSSQTVCFIARTFHCNVDFLYGISDSINDDYIIISRNDSPALYTLIHEMDKNSVMKKRILAYVEKLIENKSTEIE